MSHRYLIEDELTGFEEHQRDELTYFDESADQFFMRREAEEDARKEYAMYLFELEEEKRLAGLPCFNGTVNQGAGLVECNPDTCPF